MSSNVGVDGRKLPSVAPADEWFRRFPNGGTVYRSPASGGETGTAGDPSKK